MLGVLALNDSALNARVPGKSCSNVVVPILFNLTTLRPTAAAIAVVPSTPLPPLG